jgi:hypothetical protein
MKPVYFCLWWTWFLLVLLPAILLDAAASWWLIKAEDTSKWLEEKAC